MAFAPMEIIIIYLQNDYGVYILYFIESYYVVYVLISKRRYHTKRSGIVNRFDYSIHLKLIYYCVNYTHTHVTNIYNML